MPAPWGLRPASYRRPLNTLTDVASVRVGHVTLFEGEAIRTGVTAILPRGGNLYQDQVPAGGAVGNGFGKLMGSTQVVELGEIETPTRRLRACGARRRGAKGRQPSPSCPTLHGAAWSSRRSP